MRVPHLARTMHTGSTLRAPPSQRGGRRARCTYPSQPVHHHDHEWQDLAGGLLSAVAAPPGAARADSVITVDSTSQGLGVPGCTLPEAILAANRDASTVPLPASNGLSFETGCAAGSGNDLIDLTPGTYSFADVIDDASNYVGPAATPIITSAVDPGHGALIERTGSTTSVRSRCSAATWCSTSAREGIRRQRRVRRKRRRRRGLGAGGAIYVHDGSLLVQWSTFEGNSATGGNGGGRQDIGGVGGGGGGGIGGNGGANSSSGGGGGGSRTAGASGGSFGTAAAAVARSHRPEVSPSRPVPRRIPLRRRSA